jgi:hypothetical protein
MKTLIGITLTVLLCIVSSCDPNSDGQWDGKLKIVNNTTDSLYSIIQYNYPDTLLIDTGSGEITANFIATGETKKVFSSMKWERRISTINEQKTISIFLFTVDTLDKYPWSQIKKDNKILQRYALSVDDLIKLDWKVTYPPSPQMKDMKMYPPYKEQ